MDDRWEYDHEYFQQMIEHEQRVDNEAVGDIITNLLEAIKSNSSSSEDESMPGYQERAREDSFSNEDTNLFGEDGIYDDNEPWGFKALTLKQIIGGKPGGMFFNNISTLYAFSWHGYTQVGKNPAGIEKSACRCLSDSKEHFWQCKLDSQYRLDVYQAKE